MKRLASTELTVVHSREDIPSTEMKSLFLAGPTPRKKHNLEWRSEAIKILKELGYNGIVYTPTERKGEFDRNVLKEQCAWEYKTMMACDAIVFWIPRQKRQDFEMIALTTNVEFGRFFESNKMFCGAPNDAKSIEYLKIISENRYEWTNTLRDTLKRAVDYLGEGVYREGAECLVPKHIFESAQFQNWYKSHKQNGNQLTDFKTLFEFIAPYSKKMFMTIFKPDVFIEKENRTKNNEFVVARTDVSYICAYHKTKKETKILLCEEFRSPVVNDDSMVYELVGGSSDNPNDDELQVAANEFEEETGVKLKKSRFKKVDIKQSAATLCSHRITLYSVELTDEEIKHFEEDKDIHGVTEATEQIHLHVMTLEDALKKVDWTNAGMIFAAMKGKE